MKCLLPKPPIDSNLWDGSYPNGRFCTTHTENSTVRIIREQISLT